MYCKDCGKWWEECICDEKPPEGSGSRQERLVMPVPGERWALKSNPDRIATVIDVIDDTDDEWPDWPRGYVYLSANWYKRGHGGKSLDTFLSKFSRA